MSRRRLAFRRIAAALCGAATCAALAPAAHAQLPALPPLPSLGDGPVPQINPVEGQDPVPTVLRDCEEADPAPPVSNGLDARAPAAGAPNPLNGLRFFVDPTEPAYQKFESFSRQGRDREATLMWKIAGQPRFRWFGRFTRPNMRKKIRDYLNCVQALQPGAVPLMTVMRHQGKKCGGDYDGGGAAEDARTRDWYDAFAEEVGDARVVIAFEPDSLGTIDCLGRRHRSARMRLLRYGVDRLSRMPNATIYLEAGASDWEPAKRTAWQLRYIGIHKVRGFMLNVTHYDWTGHNIRHGLKISRRTGGKHFIINTASSGRGPVHVRKRFGHGVYRTLNVWCHPLKRGLGPSPSTRTAHPKVDAYAWISRPGFSSGSCNGGPLPVGSFWTDRALMFATHATNWLRPPRGTRNGHYGRQSAHALGYCGDRCT